MLVTVFDEIYMKALISRKWPLVASCESVFEKHMNWRLEKIITITTRAILIFLSKHTGPLK